jgi:hypothetical protein
MRRGQGRSPSPQQQPVAQPRGVINVIAGGIPAKSKRTCDGQELCAQVIPITDVTLSFTKDDFLAGKIRDNELLVITRLLDDFEVHRIFVDQGSSANIVLWSLFEKLGLGTRDLVLHPKSLIGFTGDTIIPKGYVELV